MTPQEIFDHAVMFLRETGGRDARRVLGSLIPSSLYEPWMSDAGAEAVCRSTPVHGEGEQTNSHAGALPSFIAVNLRLLNSLAWVEGVPSHWDHDAVMQAALGFVARKYGLNHASTLEGGFVHTMEEEEPDPREIEMASKGYWAALPPPSALP